MERNNFVFYRAHSNISTEVVDAVVDILEMVIVDENDNEVNFNGVEWSMTLGFVFDSVKQPPPPMKTVPQEVDYLEQKVGR